LWLRPTCALPVPLPVLLPVRAQVLDLSYNPIRTLAGALFGACPQLLQLSLEGCGFDSTASDTGSGTAAAGGGCGGAGGCVFAPLAKLQMLNLAANQLPASELLGGRGGQGLPLEAYFLTCNMLKSIGEHRALRAVRGQPTAVVCGVCVCVCACERMCVCACVCVCV
jgi:hypothetical protein